MLTPLSLAVISVLLGVISVSIAIFSEYRAIRTRRLIELQLSHIASSNQEMINVAHDENLGIQEKLVQMYFLADKKQFEEINGLFHALQLKNWWLHLIKPTFRR